MSSTAQSHPARPSLDSALTRQVYAMGPRVSEAEWADVASGLQFRQQPVWFGIGRGYVSLRSRMLYCPLNLDGSERIMLSGIYSYRPHPLSNNHWLRYSGTHRWLASAGLRQLNNYMDNLDLERRQSEYERLSMVLREKASKMRKLEAALPVLVFALNDEGKVMDVTVDPSRTKQGLTRRSRGILLKALRDERFRLPARQYTVTTKATRYQPAGRFALEEPRPMAEKLQRLSLGYRAKRLGQGLAWVATPLRLPVKALLYKKLTLHGRCGETRIEWVPRFWGRY